MSRTTEVLRASRIAANLTQDGLAGMLGITQGFLSDIENGRRELPERHYANLPDPIREAVVLAAVGDLRKQMTDRIQELLNLIR